MPALKEVKLREDLYDHIILAILSYCVKAKAWAWPLRDC